MKCKYEFDIDSMASSIHFFLNCVNIVYGKIIKMAACFKTKVEILVLLIPA